MVGTRCVHSFSAVCFSWVSLVLAASSTHDARWRLNRWEGSRVGWQLTSNSTSLMPTLCPGVLATVPRPFGTLARTHDPTPPRKQILTTEQTAQPEKTKPSSGHLPGQHHGQGPQNKQSDDCNTHGERGYLQSPSGHHSGIPTAPASSTPAPGRSRIFDSHVCSCVLRVILIGEFNPLTSTFVSRNFSIFHIFLIVFSKSVIFNEVDFNSWNRGLHEFYVYICVYGSSESYYYISAYAAHQSGLVLWYRIVIVLALRQHSVDVIPI